MGSHPFNTVGFTHASMVIPVVRSSGVPAAPSITVTQSLVPLKDNALPTLPGTRTAPVMVPLRALDDESVAVVPLASSKPSASVSPDGPDETTKATALPGAALKPPVGVWLMTEPRATVELVAVVTVDVRPEAVIAACAEICVDPTTAGTSAPSETVILTALPTGTFLAATGFCVMMVPIGKIRLFAVEMAPTTRPAPVIDAVATACVSPMRLGTTATGATATSRFTRPPIASLVPPAGNWPRTVPTGTVVVSIPVVAPTCRPTAVIAAAAAVSINPTTFGTIAVATKTGVGMVISLNCSCSMFSSVSVPLLPGPTIPGVVPLSVTITRLPNPAVPNTVIVYWARGPENTAVSQLSGVTAPQSAGGTTGVTMVR